jgi:hypothetical protein
MAENRRLLFAAAAAVGRRRAGIGVNSQLLVAQFPNI